MLRTNVVALPEGLFAEIFAGLSEQVALEGAPGMTQMKFTSAGKFDPLGVVVNVSATLEGAPAVTATVPVVDCAKVKSTLLRANVAGAPRPAIVAVML